MSDYDFQMPDRTEKYPIPDQSKTKEELQKDLNMVTKAMISIDEIIETVNWQLLMPDPVITEFFIESKTGLLSAYKKLGKVSAAIALEFQNQSRKESA